MQKSPSGEFSGCNGVFGVVLDVDKCTGASDVVGRPGVGTVVRVVAGAGIGARGKVVIHSSKSFSAQS